MIIFISSKYKKLRNDLIKRGYEIIEKDEDKICDAILCDIKSGGLNETVSNKIRNEGTLIIDTGSKTADDIEYILNSRRN